MQGLRRLFILPLLYRRHYYILAYCHHFQHLKKGNLTARKMSGIVEFPVWGLLPKKETGITQFLNRYPEYDGRGIVIAIFDSGVDPGAAGLQRTSDDKVKIIERHDCSGAGDVDTSTVVEAVDGCIKGLTGRTLKIPDDWCNPTNKYHIGVKNGFDLYPKDLLDRIKKQRKEKNWDPSHKAAIAEASKELQNFETKNSSSILNGLEKLTKENLEAKVDVLTSMEKKYKDLGPVYDCVVFHDGTMWRACLDVSEEGDLAKGTLLGEYSLSYMYASLTKEDQLNYTINVHNDGNLLEIVALTSSHGTHVASIAASYFPDEPERNGIAPGAQIISCCIGDSRIEGMETGTALVRAMIRVMQRTKDKPIHVINMSYGEHPHWSSSGRICELMSEVVNKHSVIWVSSAGNKGPGLCTIGTPPDITTNCMIGVGAYVSPEMMVAGYSFHEKLPGMPYTWTSRGPTSDGEIGVTVCAPGGAITSVPVFTLSGSQLMSGTSMASPHVCGAVAVLLSGMEQQNLKYSPHSVKRALQNGASFLPSVDPFAQGSGLLQVEKSFELLCKYSTSVERNVRFAIYCGSDNAKGIHIRDGLGNKIRDIGVRVKPEFPEDTEAQEKVQFNMKLAMVCSEPWVEAPSHLDLFNGSRNFNIRLDPCALTEGVHSTSLRAYDTNGPEKGVMFSILITLVKPITFPDENEIDLRFKDVQFKVNTIKRHFILVPPKATWAVLKVKCTEPNKTGKFYLHCMQLRPKTVCSRIEYKKPFVLTSDVQNALAFAVRGDLVLELALAKAWDSVGDMLLDYTLEFHGVKPDSPNFTMQAADGIYGIDISTSPRLDKILPSVTLKSNVIAVRPSDSTITALTTPRDIIPPGRYIYENILTYNFHVSKGTEITPFNPILCDVLYESEFESQLWMLYDSKKYHIASGDAYPRKYTPKVEKGDYVLKMHIRHEKRELLEKFSDSVLLVAQKLSSPLSLDIYSSLAEAMMFGKKVSDYMIPSMNRLTRAYIGPLASDKLSKLSMGQYLSGTISFAKDEIGKKVDTYAFKYVMNEPSKKSSSSASSKEKGKTKVQEYTEAMTDLKIDWLGKLEPSKDANSLYESLVSSYPENLAVHSAMLQSLDPHDLEKGKDSLLPFISNNFDDQERQELVEKNKTIIELADKIIDKIDSDKLLMYAGMVHDMGPDAHSIKPQMEKQKNYLIEALCKKGCALCRIYYLQITSNLSEEMGDSPERKDPGVEVINCTLQELMKFVDQNDTKVIYFMMWHAAISKHYGRLVKYLQKLLDEKPATALDGKLLEVFQKLHWNHCEKLFRSNMQAKYPGSYKLF